MEALSLRWYPDMKSGKCARIALGVLLAMGAGCDGVPDPVTTARGPADVRPSPSPGAFPFPALPDSVPAYYRVSPTYVPGASRYVFPTDSTFSLQYSTPDWGFLEYAGSYTRSDSTIAFDFSASHLAHWFAAGTIHGDSLTVTYHELLMLSDFEDGTFVRPRKNAAAVYLTRATISVAP